MANRPKGFGLTAELADKTDSKYNAKLAGQCVDWMNAVTEQQLVKPSDADDSSKLHEALKDGTSLVKLANKLGGNFKINENKMAFKMMENISHFLDFCDKIMAVPKTDMFQTVDLYEAQNMAQVVNGLYACGRKASSSKRTTHELGPKEATANKREFTEEQLRDGHTHVAPQSGFNKGATQAGEHFGRPRQAAGHEAYK